MVSCEARANEAKEDKDAKCDFAALSTSVETQSKKAWDPTSFLRLFQKQVALVKGMCSKTSLEAAKSSKKRKKAQADEAKASPEDLPEVRQDASAAATVVLATISQTAQKIADLDHACADTPGLGVLPDFLKMLEAQKSWKTVKQWYAKAKDGDEGYVSASVSSAPFINAIRGAVNKIRKDKTLFMYDFLPTGDNIDLHKILYNMSCYWARAGHSH
eukprot:6928877-Alexandrium_andersonii.AAC.1